MRKGLLVASSLALLLGSTGCSPLHVAYSPDDAIVAPMTGLDVAVQVTDERESDHRGPGVVGQMRGPHGVPSNMEDVDPDVVVHSVTDATKDALYRAGINSTGKGKTLLARVEDYWLDGYMGYKGTVTVEFSLVDASGKALWNLRVSEAARPSDVFVTGNSTTQGIFREALGKMATDAVTQFQSPDFLNAAKQ